MTKAELIYKMKHGVVRIEPLPAAADAQTPDTQTPEVQPPEPTPDAAYIAKMKIVYARLAGDQRDNHC